MRVSSSAKIDGFKKSIRLFLKASKHRDRSKNMFKKKLFGGGDVATGRPFAKSNQLILPRF